MLYLSQLLGRPIREVEGERVATLKDVIVRLGEDHPPVTGLVARYRRRDFFVPRARGATARCSSPATCSTSSSSTWTASASSASTTCSSSRPAASGVSPAPT